MRQRNVSNCFDIWKPHSVSIEDHNWAKSRDKDVVHRQTLRHWGIQISNAIKRLTTTGWDVLGGLVKAVEWFDTKGILEQWDLRVDISFVELYG